MQRWGSKKVDKIPGTALCRPVSLYYSIVLYIIEKQVYATMF